MAGPIASGERLQERYRLERTLGRGGMAAVWLGHDEVLDRPVAVKVLSDTIASDPSFVARFRREAVTLARLSHPSLVGVYDFSGEGERPYLVMELVPGEDLASIARRDEEIDREQLARELLGALSHIHRAGVLHRDVKPANVILCPEGTAKLIDFGIALPEDATPLTRTGLVIGTERYVAPEVMEGRPATERSDLYSCGVVLHECPGRASRRLDPLVAAMTSRQVDDRPPSAARALDHLTAAPPPRGEPTAPVASGRPDATRRMPPAGEGRPPPAAPRKGRRRLAAAAALALLAALAVAAVTLTDRGGEPTTAARPQASEGAAQQRAAEEPASRPGAEESPEPAPQPEAGESAQSDREPEAGEGAESAPRPEGSQGMPTDGARGASLNERGYSMIQAGEYSEAVPVLEEAVGSFPEGSDDLDYAYALFNLGNALRLSGRPEEAIPVLEKRLEIPNQTGEVRRELDAAYADAGKPKPLEGKG